jgi:hypothetical protein
VASTRRPASATNPAELATAATSHVITALVLLDPELAADTLFQLECIFELFQ